MAYSAQTFVAGEQPTTAKWNILWSNDASFNDGSGLNAIANPIQATSTLALDLRAGTSKLVKFTVLRQDDTTNTYKNLTVNLTGWGVYAVGAASFKSETVTFGITFDQRPIIVATYGGDNTAGATTYGSGAVQSQNAIQWAHTITTTNFIARTQTPAGASWAAGDTVFYQWMATGELT